jgi:predicted metal-dependent phosphoesterase TrpH
MIDLHVHSTASDGQYSPAEIIQKAAEKNISVIALTDHDTINGNKEAQAQADKAGLTFVHGTELSINFPTGEFHLLGMGLRRYSQDLKDLVADLTEYRRNRNQEIVDKMNLDGIEVTLEEIEGLFAESQIGRPHFASYLMKIGKVKHRQEAFDRFLGKGRPYYAAHEGADLDVAVEAIRSAGGVPVLAHPLSLYVSWGKMDETIEKIKNHGVQGLEAWHPAARINEGFKLEQLAKKLGMFVTAGSDFHGKGVRADRHLGKTSGDRKIEDRFYFEELLPHLGDFDWRETEWCKSNA